MRRRSDIGTSTYERLILTSSFSVRGLRSNIRDILTKTQNNFVRYGKAHPGEEKNATDQSVGILISLQDSIKGFEY
jgi:hypothetical protein